MWSVAVWMSPKNISNQPPASPGPETPPAEAKLPSAFESEHKWRHLPCNIFPRSWWPLRRVNVLLSNFSTLLRNHICLHCQKAQKKTFIVCIFSIFGLKYIWNQWIHKHCSQHISKYNWGQPRFLNVFLAVRCSPGFVLWLIMAPGWLT